MEARGTQAPPRLRRAAPTTSGLADVVRRAGRLSGQSMVRKFSGSPAPGFTGGAGATGEESVSGPAATPRPSRALRISFHRFPRAANDRRMVAAGAQRTLLPGNHFAAELTANRRAGQPPVGKFA